MSLVSTASAVRVDKKCLRGVLVAVILLILAVVLVSCGGNQRLPAFGSAHNAYITLPTEGSVALLHIDGLSGVISLVARTPQVNGTSPSGLALMNKFLFVANSQANTISTFSVAGDGTLSAIGDAVPTGGSGPNAVVVDPSGQYLLVTNRSLSDSVSVFSIDSGSGALTPVTGSPFYANDSPDEILMPASGNLVYVTNSRIGTVTAFTFSPSTGFLTPVPGSPFISCAGASALAIDGSGSFLYVANTSALNAGSTTVGNISGFTINNAPGATFGALTVISGSPFTMPVGNGPSAMVVDPSNRFLFATTPGGNFSIWCFEINAFSQNGQLTVVAGAPFSVSAGGLFAVIDRKGDFFYMGNQEAHGITAYTFNPNTGQPLLINGSPFSTGTAPGQMLIAD